MAHIPMEEALAHYGTKGMKWGVRKQKYTESRREYRARTKAERNEKYLDNANKTTAFALKNPDSLIYTRVPQSNRVLIASGKEFVTHLTNGGAFDAKVTGVYAKRDKDGKMQIQDLTQHQYKKTARR